MSSDAVDYRDAVMAALATMTAAIDTVIGDLHPKPAAKHDAKHDDGDRHGAATQRNTTHRPRVPAGRDTVSTRREAYTRLSGRVLDSSTGCGVIHRCSPLCHFGFNRHICRFPVSGSN